MTSIYIQRLTLFATALCLWNCSVVDRFLPVSESPAEEHLRAAAAMTTLENLAEIDALVRLNNDPLTQRIGAVLEDQAVASASFSFRRLRVHAARQLIRLEADLNVIDGAETPLQAELEGDVLLTFSDGQLVWLPHFNALRVNDTEFMHHGEFFAQATPELEAALLARVNKDIADAVIVLGRNLVRLNALPLGSIEVGAALTDFPGVIAAGTHDLGGVFTVAGSTIMIDPSVTSIALDLEFIPNISSCPADVYVSRSTFASEISNREPVGITRVFDDSGAESHFFTEISGATRSTAVIHYWFADGEPVWLEELAVEPSYRWRTWSSKQIDPRLGRHWEVIVVEKQTGCILHSQAIRVDPALMLDEEQGRPPPGSYAAFSVAFLERMSDFTIGDQHPDVALIQVHRSFLNEALHTSLKDIQIVVNFDGEDLPPRRLGGVLEPFDPEEIACEERSCRPSRSCTADLTQCIRERDDRDCTRCLFRNPLNNRCVTEGVDPICEAAKTAQNAKFDAAREACLEQVSAEQQACERLVEQELQSCELEAASERSACEEGEASVQRLAGTSAIADVELKLQASGGLSAVFSDFLIEGDMEQLRLKLSLSGALILRGSIRFAPRPDTEPLAACINAWQKSFQGRVVLPYRANSMIAPIAVAPAALSTDWSGYALSATISPPPLEALFVDKPSLLAGCHIGLTVDTVSRNLSGEASEYLAGRYRLDLQPAQTRITLADASVVYGEHAYTAAPSLSATHLTYTIGD